MTFQNLNRSLATVLSWTLCSYWFFKHKMNFTLRCLFLLLIFSTLSINEHCQLLFFSHYSMKYNKCTVQARYSEGLIQNGGFKVMDNNVLFRERAWERESQMYKVYYIIHHPKGQVMTCLTLQWTSFVSVIRYLLTSAWKVIAHAQIC